MPKETVNILLVDDDDIAIIGMKRALKKLNIAVPLVFANDGLQALDFLRKNNDSAAGPKPYIVLLDLNMPRMNGFEFLDIIRADPRLKPTIVFVLTTSNADSDKLKAYDRNVAGYIVKSEIETTFLKALKMLNLYWNIVEMPQ